MSNNWPQAEVEVRPVTAPNGLPGVLLQLPDGYIVMSPEAASGLAERVAEVAAETQGDNITGTVDPVEVAEAAEDAAALDAEIAMFDVETGKKD